jgi:hypothetical protein
LQQNQDTEGGREMTLMRWGMPPHRQAARHQRPQHLFAALARLAEG